ncbi:MAG: hypothetical protein KC646_05160 [Candidatus Cloacimonetes bacterium]|nr:hypothetical protein [Candidatus Cloacimonadota bacterium]
MKQQYQLTEWDQLWHIQLDNEPIVTKTGNILALANEKLLERLLLESDVLDSYCFTILSKIVDQEFIVFTKLWSIQNYRSICKVPNDQYSLNMPSLADYLHRKNLVFAESQEVSDRFMFALSLVYNKLDIERKVILTELVELGFDACISLAFIDGKATLSELLENQAYLNFLRFEQSEQYFLDHLDTRFKSIIEMLALL